jgi:hypothetical protein
MTDGRDPVTALLPPDDPSSWPRTDILELLALSHRDYFPLQLAALRHRFEQLNGRVAALDRLARRQGVTRVESIADALPLFFDHRVYKSYPLAIIEQRDLKKLTGWLDRLTTHDLSAMPLDGLTTIDGWLDRLTTSGCWSAIPRAPPASSASCRARAASCRRGSAPITRAIARRPASIRSPIPSPPSFPAIAAGIT